MPDALRKAAAARIVMWMGGGLAGAGIFWAWGAAGAALALEAVRAVVGVEIGRVYTGYDAPRVSAAGTGRRRAGWGCVESEGGPP